MGVEELPEEKIRQLILCQMIDELGFPPSCIAVEKSLKQMPHLALVNQQIPDRRVDIICFAKDIHPEYPLFPLLVIECKAVPLTPSVVKQVVGYNHYIKSYFIAIANGEELRTGWFDPITRAYQFVSYLPKYEELISSIN
jgi:hypothetical protein